MHGISNSFVFVLRVCSVSPDPTVLLLKHSGASLPELLVSCRASPDVVCWPTICTPYSAVMSRRSTKRNHPHYYTISRRDRWPFELDGLGDMRGRNAQSIDGGGLIGQVMFTSDLFVVPDAPVP